MSNFRYDKYSTEEIIELKKYLTKKDFELFDKLNIKIKDKKYYTEQEFEILDMDLLSYYRNNREMSKEELKESKELPKNVSIEEYNSLLAKINKINVEYGF